MNMQMLKAAAAPVISFLLAYHVARPLLRILLNHFVLTRLSGLRRNLKKFGNWAVVTGSTDGIGKAYAELLAKQGLNIALVSRSADKLRVTAAAIESEHKVETRCIVADFSDPNIYDSVQQQLRQLDIACLVNNVGMGMPHPNLFCGEAAFDMDLYCSMLNTNCLSMIRMSRIALQQMQSRGAGGVVINVASASGLQYTPLLAVYSATKAFAVYFSRSVNAELKRLQAGGAGDSSHPIVVQTVAPYFVATKLSKIRRPSFFAPSPKKFVNEALDLLGVEDSTVGCFAHAMQHAVMQMLPTCVTERLSVMVLNKARRAALSKKEKAK